MGYIRLNCYFIILKVYEINLWIIIVVSQLEYDRQLTGKRDNSTLFTIFPYQSVYTSLECLEILCAFDLQSSIRTLVLFEISFAVIGYVIHGSIF